MYSTVPYITVLNILEEKLKISENLEDVRENGQF
jgi:hypothetical protein